AGKAGEPAKTERRSRRPVIVSPTKPVGIIGGSMKTCILPLLHRNGIATPTLPGSVLNAGGRAAVFWPTRAEPPSRAAIVSRCLGIRFSGAHDIDISAGPAQTGIRPSG